MRGAKKKYVYIKIGKNRYVKARVILEGREEPTISPSTNPSKIILTGRPTKLVPEGYKVFEVDDLPPELRRKLSFELPL